MSIVKLLKSSTKIKIPPNLRILVFGGALKSNCHRDSLLDWLQEKKEFLTIIPDKINYFDITSSKYNLIEKESRLFENSDILIIIPESPGSFAEIGMISYMIANHKLEKERSSYGKKILVILDKKYKYEESFLKLGPIKIIKAHQGKSINFDFKDGNKKDIIKNFKTKEVQQFKLNDTNDDTKELFFFNCIKILIYLYYHKTLAFNPTAYKEEFIKTLKEIHIGIGIDNIEYLESAELIEKTFISAKINLSIKYSHPFIQELIKLNFKVFIENNIIQNFLKESGY